MNFKKKVNGSWTVTPHYIHNTSTDTITTLPAVLYPTGTTATVGLKGDTVQSGTPTPGNPIMPQGTGERTGNLYFKKIVNANLSDDGAITTLTGFDLYIAKVEQGVQYSGSGYIYAFFEDVPAIGSISFNGSRVVGSFRNVVSPINGFVAVRNPNTFQNAMCNTGDTILPYEPFGVKIPISSASTTTPVYLGEVEATRRVKKLVLTGQERIFANPSISASYAYYIDAVSNYKQNLKLGYCTHYPNVTNASSAEGLYMGSSINLLTKFSDGYDTVDKFKTYLQQQYAAGTPVTVWYILATETTGIVNEPLMKIGNYADEVSNVSIPVTAGGDTLSVDTTVQPSEVTVSYTGWHDATVKEWDGSQWNE